MDQAELKIEQVAVGELRPAEYNPRVWTDAARRNLGRSIDEFGFVQPLVVNSAPHRKGIVIGGNFKLDIARDKGLKTVPVVWVNLPDIRREHELSLRLNKNQGEFDLELLANFDKELLTEIGWESKEIDKIFDEDDDDEFDAEKEVSGIDIPQTKVGDVYQLGENRLVCGDATKRDDMMKLMGDEMADLIFTDPPYNVDYTGKTADALKIENDKKDDAAFREFLMAAFRTMAEFTKLGGGGIRVPCGH